MLSEKMLYITNLLCDEKMDQHRLTLARLFFPRLYTNLANNGAHIIELLLTFSNFINQPTTGCFGRFNTTLFQEYSRPHAYFNFISLHSVPLLCSRPLLLPSTITFEFSLIVDTRHVGSFTSLSCNFSH